MRESEIEIEARLAPTVEAVREVIAARDARHLGVLLVGPPGVGSAMVARRVADAYPTAPDGDLLDRVRAAQFRAYATAGMLDYKAPKAPERPFRAPHHTVSEAGLCGVTGPYAHYTGEVALAAGGVLMLDELPEFRRAAIERLAQRVGPMDHYERPFLIASALPCSCGFAGIRACSCSTSARASYEQRVTAYASVLRLTRIEVRHA